MKMQRFWVGRALLLAVAVLYAGGYVRAQEAKDTLTLTLDMLRAMRGHVRHLHVLDWTADGKLCLPGRGVFDWQQFARVLREDGFDGAVILEPYAQLVESEQALLESICFLRGVFGAPAQM